MENKEEKLKMGRNTRQKYLVLDLLEKHTDIHITVDELCDRLKCNNTPVARATVYRQLAFLEKEGIVRKFTIDEGMPVCYQYVEGGCRAGGHYHLMCNICGKVEHFNSRHLQQAFDVMQKEEEREIDGLKTVFRGVCSNCKPSK